MTKKEDEDEYLKAQMEELLTRVSHEILKEYVDSCLKSLQELVDSKKGDTMLHIIVISTIIVKLLDLRQSMEEELLKDYHKNKGLN